MGKILDLPLKKEWHELIGATKEDIAMLYENEAKELLKEALIKSIQDCENPFSFICYSTDSGWNYTEKDLFKLV